MKNIFYIITFLFALASCSEQNKNENSVKSTKNTSTEKTEMKKPLVYRQIELKENSIDSFNLPFPEKNMLMPLLKYYKPYWVEANLGQQDGPDFMYIDILRLETPIVYFNFESENEYLLNSITVLDSTVADQYDLHVGDSMDKMKTQRGIGTISFDPYHQHVYYLFEDSNISYEINGDLEIPSDIENMEDMVITETEIKNWTIQYIIWRK